MFYDASKRLIDILGSVFGLVLLSPLFLLVGILIKLDSPGSIFYSHKRVGRGGDEFPLYKFRSMVRNADAILWSDPKLLAEYKKSSFKLNNDPRVTRVGRIIRKFSIDELPQFWNILKGQMSVVGPRPYLKKELEDQQKVYPQTRELIKALLLVKPGVTGFWQVSGRSDVNFDERIKMDVEYVKRRSLVYDFSIMIETIPAVIKGRGAR
ncbi:MAG: sugar transferase [Patescibacteria group bacterium]|nr:sugar transferase [Patescibacteria group bacterium]